MLSLATAATPWGIEAVPVQVEVDIQNGLPQMQIVGLPDTAVRESRERVRAAVRNCGFRLPPRAIVVNLAPADLRKAGNHLDLAIALSLLTAFGELPSDCLGGRLFCGELGLDGAIRPIRGGLAIADLAHRLELDELMLPLANSREAAALNGIPVIGITSLAEAIEHLVGTRPLTKATRAKTEPSRSEPSEDLAEVRGQETAKRCLEIAAAGGHNLLFVGPPGSGKTMLARRLPALLPALTLGESIELTKIHSSVADQPPSGLIRERPFRSPHSGTSAAAMIGGGSIPRPGEVSLAHHGVLFLDELPEFRRDALEALRQPLEEAVVTVVRTRARLTFPARFALLGAMNPCPCGYLGDPRHECRCSPVQIERYRGRISGPMLDRIDLHVEVPAVKLLELKSPPGEPSSEVCQRIGLARARQLERLSRHTGCSRQEALDGTGASTNAALGSENVGRFCQLDPTAQKLLDRAFEQLGLSARGLVRVLKVARTIADLAGADQIGSGHVAEAIQYRSLDHRLSK